MTQCWKHRRWQLGLISCLVIAGTNTLLSVDGAFAQIVPDRTLGAERSIVTPIPRDIDVISGGATRGTNLFHSFSQFSVLTGRVAFFNNAANIQNIISRVTGASVSNINGSIAANGKANVFLINPNGIIFGPNASLKIGGSFVASTASNLKFADGTEFSATSPQTSPLLTISVPIGLQLGTNPGSILNQSQVPGTSGRTDGLQVQSGQTLALVGGSVSFNGGNSRAPGSRVELGGLAEAGTVGLNVDTSNLTLSFPDGVARADVSLTNGSKVNVSGGGGGSIAVNARDLDVSGGSLLGAGIRTGSGTVGSKAGNIDINAADTVTVDGTSSTDFSSGILNVVQGSGTAGNITINTGTLNIIGNAQIGSLTNGQGDAGSVTLRARDRVLISGTTGTNSGVVSTVFDLGVGNGSDINIQTRSLSLSNGALVSTGTSGQGNAGNIQINASDSVSVGSGSFIVSGVLDSSSPGVVANGKGGNIDIKAGTLSLTNGAHLSADTYGHGDAGSVTINVSGPVSFAGVGSNGLPSGASSDVGSTGVGKGGDINVMAGSLSLTNGAQISTDTFGRGDAGNVTINASGPVSFDGVGGSPSVSSGATSEVGSTAVGKGGDINVMAGSLSLTNGAQLFADTFGRGDAGNVTINASGPVSFDGVGSSSLSVSSGATSEVGSTAVGKGGEINVMAGSLSLTNGAQLFADTFGSGDAGSVTINVSGPVSFDGVGSNRVHSAANSAVGSTGVGKGGDINVMAESFSLTNGAQLGADTRGRGDAGSVTINASGPVSFDGVGSDGVVSGAISNVESTGVGKGGDINVMAESFSLTNGAVLNSSTSGRGDAGSVTINASGPVSFNGVGSSGVHSGAISNVQPTGVGKGGDINVTAGSFSLTNGAGSTVSSLGQGNAGNLQIQAGTVTFDGGSALLGITASTEGGNINLKAQDMLLLRHGSLISTTAGTESAGGNGGNITLNTPLLVAIPQENSDISANAFTGNGGTVNVNASGIFGIQFQKQPTPESDITASSQFGVNGTVNINTPNVNPSYGLATLPAVVVDPSRLIAQGCGARDGTTNSQFVVTGRGGLPPNPSEVLSRNAVLADTRLPTTTAPPQRSAIVTPASPKLGTLPAPATGAMFNGRGQVTLIAAAPTARLEISWLAPHTCHVN